MSGQPNQQESLMYNQYKQFQRFQTTYSLDYDWKRSQQSPLPFQQQQFLNNNNSSNTNHTSALLNRLIASRGASPEQRLQRYYKTVDENSHSLISSSSTTAAANNVKVNGSNYVSPSAIHARREYPYINTLIDRATSPNKSAYSTGFNNPSPTIISNNKSPIRAAAVGWGAADQYNNNDDNGISRSKSPINYQDAGSSSPYMKGPDYPLIDILSPQKKPVDIYSIVENESNTNNVAADHLIRNSQPTYPIPLPPKTSLQQELPIKYTSQSIFQKEGQQQQQQYSPNSLGTKGMISTKGQQQQQQQQQQYQGTNTSEIPFHNYGWNHKTDPGAEGYLTTFNVRVHKDSQIEPATNQRLKAQQKLRDDLEYMKEELHPSKETVLLDNKTAQIYAAKSNKNNNNNNNYLRETYENGKQEFYQSSVSPMLSQYLQLAKSIATNNSNNNNNNSKSDNSTWAGPLDQPVNNSNNSNNKQQRKDSKVNSDREKTFTDLMIMKSKIKYPGDKNDFANVNDIKQSEKEQKKKFLFQPIFKPARPSTTASERQSKVGGGPRTVTSAKQLPAGVRFA